MNTSKVIVARGVAFLLGLAALGCASGTSDDTPVRPLDGKPQAALASLNAPLTVAEPAASPAAKGGSRSCVHDGDPTGDGVVSSGDAQRAFYIALGVITPTPDEFCSADCNADGVVSSGDAQIIFYVALGIGECAGELTVARPVIVPGAGHVRGVTDSGLRVRFGLGLATPIGTSTPAASGHSADFGAYPIVKDF